MQHIVLYHRIGDNTINLYDTSHIRNGSYLEREDETDKFKVLDQVCDVSPTGFRDDFDLLISDLTIALKEAKKNNDTEITLHIIEIIVLCKFCIWNKGYYGITFFPWDVIKYPDGYPKDMPESLLKSLDGLTPALSD